MRTRVVPVVLLAAAVAAFVASGLHSGTQGLQPAPASVSEPEIAVAQTRVVYYVDATVCDRTKSACTIVETKKNADGTLHTTIRPATTP